MISTGRSVAPIPSIKKALPLLSVCIPSFNRREMVTALVRELLADSSAPLEVCVHDDGSTDGTDAALKEIQENDERLSLSRSANCGRAGAMLAAVRNSRGKFIMIFDDDDLLEPGAVSTLVQRCKTRLPEGVGGFIFHMDFEDGQTPTHFPKHRSNFLKLRADEGVRGDKKEVVLADLLKSRAFDPKGRVRRAPLSLNWSRIALTHDVICVNETVGVKRYLSDGITASITRSKRRNAHPMLLLYIVQVEGFIRGRYQSLGFCSKALVGAAFYGALSLVQLLRRPR